MTHLRRVTIRGLSDSQILADRLIEHTVPFWAMPSVENKWIWHFEFDHTHAPLVNRLISGDFQTGMYKPRPLAQIT